MLIFNEGKVIGPTWARAVMVLLHNACKPISTHGDGENFNLSPLLCQSLLGGGKKCVKS